MNTSLYYLSLQGIVFSFFIPKAGMGLICWLLAAKPSPYLSFSDSAVFVARSYMLEAIGSTVTIWRATNIKPVGSYPSLKRFHCSASTVYRSTTAFQLKCYYDAL